MEQIPLNENTLVINLPTRIGFERIAMVASASFAINIGFQQDRIEDLKTAVSEACLNAMEHGNKCDPGARVTITMSYDDHVLSVSVEDAGKGIEKFPEEPDVEEKIGRLQTPRGLGIFLIKKLVDEVEFNKITKEGHMMRMNLRMKG